MALNSELFSDLTCLLIDTSKYFVQLFHSLWRVAALLCGVANLSMFFELNGAPLSDSRRSRFGPTRVTLVGGECSYRLSFQPWLSRCARYPPHHHQPGFSVLRQLCGMQTRWSLGKIIPTVGKCSFQIFSCLNLKIIFSLET